MAHFSVMVDPRVERTRRHSLNDILVIAICGFVCGVDNWVELEFFGKTKERWFKQFLELPNGIPSHDTFGRVFAALDPEAFSRCFMSWMKVVSEATEGEIVAIDGKTLRRSFDHAAKKAAIHMVSAWSTHNGVVLGQVKTDDKSNEITAVPKLLELLRVGMHRHARRDGVPARNRAADCRQGRPLSHQPQGKPGNAARRGGAALHRGTGGAL